MKVWQSPSRWAKTGTRDFGLDAFHQGLAAARHNHVDRAAETGEHFANRGAIGGADQLDGVERQLGGFKSFKQAGMNGPRRPRCIGAATQDHGIA